MSLNANPTAQSISAFQRMQSGFLACACAALFCMTAINVVNVICRYVLSSPLTWADEAMSFLMAFSIFFGAIAVTARANHICVDLLVQAFPERLANAVRVIGNLLAAALLLLLGLASASVINMLRLFDQRSDALEIPVWLVQVSLTIFLLISAGLLIYQAVQLLRHPPMHKGK